MKRIIDLLIVGIILPGLILVALLMNFVSKGHAGLDNENHGEVIALYRMENEDDVGSRNLHSKTNGTFVAGKNEKALLLKGQEYFAVTDDDELRLYSHFTIAAWIKLGNQTSDFEILVGSNEKEFVAYISLAVEKTGNIRGVFRSDDKDSNRSVVRTQNRNVTDGKWHHLVFTSYNNLHRLYIDGEEIIRKKINWSHIADLDTTLVCISSACDKWISGILAEENITVRGENIIGTAKNVLVDDVVILQTDLSEYEVKGLMADGLGKFLKRMPVDPQDMITTTWSKLKG
ncbi:hypothetical protein C6503_03535 [Candidatus Poribacteria bacterium]|nr:MAG: hypothetical protein C6503_03535 [Candidatus Poribacteria bacterium]